ncbi:MAG TPA: hypothetical protein VEB66_18015 [Opitutaceae bacterium]|nr:hypothetical protein [Opitutaceae bacterium]
MPTPTPTVRPCFERLDCARRGDCLVVIAKLASGTTIPHLCCCECAGYQPEMDREQRRADIAALVVIGQVIVRGLERGDR